jgi:hypothetical protein
MIARFTRSMLASLRLVALAVGWLLIACFTTLGVAAAGPSPLPPVELPLSSECHEAVSTYMREEHFDRDLPVALFERHEAQMKAAWYVAEFDCGLDINQDGRLGY